jgi:hypothetical protein
MKTTPLIATALALALSLPCAAQAAPRDQGISAEVRQELADARKEVRVELAKARKELETGNLRLDDGVRIGQRAHELDDLPRAEITPAGDLLVDGKAQPLDAAQREQMLAYRRQVVSIAVAGIEVGQKSAEAALDAVGDSWLAMVFNAMTGRLERRVERVVQEQVQPLVKTVCGQLPALMESQQRLARSVPAFQPYATLEPGDIEDCEADFRREFASR